MLVEAGWSSCWGGAGMLNLSVTSEGSRRPASMASGLNGHIPVALKALLIAMGV